MINAYIYLATMVCACMHIAISTHIYTLIATHRDNIFHYICSLATACLTAIGASISTVCAMYAFTFISAIMWFIVAVLWCQNSIRAFQRLKYYYLEKKNKNNHNKKEGL